MLETNHHFYARMQQSGNYLLVKDDVGRAKPSIRTLPPKDFAYGKKVGADQQGAGAVISSWKSHQGSRQLPNDRDFKKLNAMSVSMGCTRANQQREFRANTNVRLQDPKIGGRNMKVPDIIFGQPMRPSTPIEAVVGHYYGNVAMDYKHGAYTPVDDRKVLGHPRSTRGFDKMKTAIQKQMERPTKSEFKMKKFQTVQARTESRRI